MHGRYLRSVAKRIGLYKSKTWMERKLQDERKTPVEIANELGVAQDTIYRWMDKHGLKRP